MKTTIEISNKLFQDAKKFAIEKNKTFREVIEESLNQFLYHEGKAKPQGKFKIHTFKGDGLVEGLVEGDWAEIRARLYEGRGG